jgi:hypothetical protein
LCANQAANMLLDIPATLQISTHVLTGRVARLSRKSNMDIGSNPTARYSSWCQHTADMSASDMLWHVGPVPLPTAFCVMLPTCWPTCLWHAGLTKNMSVVLTLVLTRQHPTLPAKVFTFHVSK